MGKFNLTEFIDATKHVVSKHSPEILTGIGIGGMIVSTVLAVQSTPKAMRLIEEERERKNSEELTKTEIIKTTWKCYIPTVVTTAASVACLVGASSVSLKRNAVLATAYTLSEKTLKEYKDAVIDTIGEKKEHSVREKVAEKRLENDPVSKHDVIVTGGGETLCYDSIGGRYFKSSIEKIRKAENNANRILMRDGSLSLNELYFELGLDQTRLGDELGWQWNGVLIDLELTAKIAENNEPCIVFDYSEPPTYGFNMYG